MFPLLDRNLPHVEEKILSYLEPKGLATAMLVSKQWYQRAKPLLCEWYAYIQRKNGDVPLHMAVAHGYDHLITFFLQDERYDINEICSHTGKTALMEAALSGNYRITKMLLGRDDIDVNMVSNQGQYAISHAHSDKLLHTYIRRNALQLAARNGHAGIVKLLVERGDTDVKAALGPFGNIALIEGVMHMHASVVEEILKHPDIDVNMAGGNGCSPLSLAKDLPVWPTTLKGRQKIIAMLEERSAK